MKLLLAYLTVFVVHHTLVTGQAISQVRYHNYISFLKISALNPIRLKKYQKNVKLLKGL